MLRNKGLYKSELPEIPLLKRGKVRDIYDLGDKLLIVATDRISAFDVVLPTAIPDKGKILNQISCFWFKETSPIIKNHLITCEIEEFLDVLQEYRNLLQGRSMVVRKVEVIPIECVVRGYLAGSAWKEYSQKAEVQGIRLSPGLKEGDRLPHPLFTPSTKEEGKHDRPLTHREMEEKIGKERTRFLQEKSLEIYQFASKYAEEKGIIICDTKFEFGEIDGEIILIDELLTPDSSRFWPKERWHPGRKQEDFDKQVVRDYLDSLDWDKTPPGPSLPANIVELARERYLEAYRRIIGKSPEV